MRAPAARARSIPSTSALRAASMSSVSGDPAHRWVGANAVNKTATISPDRRQRRSVFPFLRSRRGWNLSRFAREFEFVRVSHQLQHGQVDQQHAGQQKLVGGNRVERAGQGCFVSDLQGMFDARDRAETTGAGRGLHGSQLRFQVDRPAGAGTVANRSQTWNASARDGSARPRATGARRRSENRRPDVALRCQGFAQTGVLRKPERLRHPRFVAQAFVDADRPVVVAEEDQTTRGRNRAS